ncbi:hypothetical protein [Actinokineospora sp.]|uniref:hypothetical protein n=1 Tax=Actinokineospora sp. TaxID=1872133 RepID=UPI004037EAA2
MIIEPNDTTPPTPTAKPLMDEFEQLYARLSRDEADAVYALLRVLTINRST